MTLRIYARAEWGARYPDGCASAPLPATYLWLHHSVTTPPPVDATFDQDAAAVRLLELIGQQRFGCGISYTFAVPPSGRCFAGHSLNRQGTHTHNHNDDSRAVVLVGDYSIRRPNSAQLSTVAALVAHGRAAGWWTSWLSGGHRDAEPAGYTECPGDAGEAAIVDINLRAKAIAQPGLVKEDEGMYILRCDGKPLHLVLGTRRLAIDNADRAELAARGVLERNLTADPDLWARIVDRLDG